MFKKQLGLIFLGSVVALLLGGCGFFNAFNPNNAIEPVSSDDVWVDSAVYAETQISPMALGNKGGNQP